MSGIWDPSRAELDMEPPDAQIPRVVYVVCSTERSGSGLLCRSLADAGLGLPAEYFNSNQRVPLSRRWGCGSRIGDYARALLSYRTTRNGVFGTKLHWHQLEQLGCELNINVRHPEGAANVLHRLFQAPVLVDLLRLDVDAQAVSLWRAMHTGVWSLHGSDQPREICVPYSSAGLRWCRNRIDEGTSGWHRLVSQGLLPHVGVTYERMITDPLGEITRIVDVMSESRGLALPVPQSLTAPDSVRQADPLGSDGLLERFRHEVGRGSSAPPLTPGAIAWRIKQGLRRPARVR